MPRSKWQPKPQPTEIQTIRKLGTPSSVSLLEDVRQFKITPAQAVARFFDNGKPNNAGLQFWGTLREVLQLLPQCDWENDPNVKRIEEDPSMRWVEMDPENKNQVTLVFTSEEAVIEHGIKPLLGQAFDFKAWVEDLTHGRIADPEGELQRAAAVAEGQPLAGHGATDGKDRDPATGLFKAAQDAEPLGVHGGAMGLESRGDNGTSGRGSNSQAYILRRLARDAPEILERVKAGEFRSARAAGIEAGIIKPVAVVRLTTPDAIAAKLQQHLNPDDLAQIVAILTEALAG